MRLFDTIIKEIFLVFDNESCNIRTNNNNIRLKY